MIGEAIKSVFLKTVDPTLLEPLLTAFENGLTVTVSDSADAYSYVHQVSAVDSLGDVIGSLVTTSSPQESASAIEFVLEGLHQVRKVSRRSRGGNVTRYSI